MRLMHQLSVVSFFSVPADGYSTIASGTRNCAMSLKTIRGYLQRGRGFTLVELAIVLVIIGIILVWVLKGDELINNSKIKRANNLYRETMAAYYTYFDKYQRLPGDDDRATTRWTDAVSGNADGEIDGDFIFNCTEDEIIGEESCNAWRHLRLSNIITGSRRNNPGHPFGGTVALAHGTVNNVVSNWIAMSAIPTDVAESLDEQYDDGEWDTGTFMAETDYEIGGTVILYMKP